MNSTLLGGLFDAKSLILPACLLVRLPSSFHGSLTLFLTIILVFYQREEKCRMNFLFHKTGRAVSLPYLNKPHQLSVQIVRPVPLPFPLQID